jgi:hypothetical protein
MQIVLVGMELSHFPALEAAYENKSSRFVTVSRLSANYIESRHRSPPRSFALITASASAAAEYLASLRRKLAPTVGTPGLGLLSRRGFLLRLVRKHERLTFLPGYFYDELFVLNGRCTRKYTVGLSLT